MDWFSYFFNKTLSTIVLFLCFFWYFLNFVYLFQIFFLVFPCRLDYRIYRLHLCRGVRPPTNECPWYDTKQSDGEDPVMLEFGEIRSTPSLPSLQGSLWPGVVAPDRVLSIGQIELKCVLMLSWIVWNRTVLTFKLRTYTKLNCFKWNCFCILNRIVWNRTVFDIETKLNYLK